MKNLSIFDFEPIRVLDEKIRDGDFTTWIGKNLPTFVSILANLIEESKFFVTPIQKIWLNHLLMILMG